MSADVHRSVLDFVTTRHFIPRCLPSLLNAFAISRVVMNLASVRERLERRSRRRRNTYRFRQIASVAVRYGLADRLRKMPGKRMQQWLRGSAGQSIVDLSTPVRIRLALSELGTTFIKFGQMLSTRPDLVGQDVADELTHLQSQTPPDPLGVAEATIQKEPGSPPATLFASFEPTPFASASIAQVHHARLHSGESVVVKVQKDGIESRVEADLSMLADLAAWPNAMSRPEAVPPSPSSAIHEDDARRARFPARLGNIQRSARTSPRTTRPFSIRIPSCAHDAS